MPWAPLLHDEVAASALMVVRELANALAGSPQPVESACHRTMFWAYASGVFDEPFASAAYDAALDDLIVLLQRGAHAPALYDGLAGLGWTLAHVLDGDGQDVLAQIDAELVGAIAASSDHDLIRGLVGIGVYFLERGDAPIARDGLALVVRRLAAAAVRTDEGTTWLTTPAMLPSDYAAAWPEGFYDCGVAHGTPGVLALLAHVPEARPLCAEAIRWVLAQRQPDGRFPTRVAPARPRDRARAAWCYGEPGIATALWSASARLGTPAAHAREIALDAARREAASCGVRDAKLCHGAAGLAHLFNRLYQASGEAELGAAARAWFARTLERRPSAGFDAPIGDFLEGEIGIALALLAAVTPVEPRWDRLLLCDVPPA